MYERDGSAFQFQPYKSVILIKTDKTTYGRLLRRAANILTNLEFWGREMSNLIVLRSLWNNYDIDILQTSKDT